MDTYYLMDKVIKMEKKFKVSVSYSDIIEAENEEEAIEEFNNIMDNTYLKKDVEEIEE